MRYRRLGRSGLRVSGYGLGTMNMGGQLDAAKSHRLLDAALDGGINLIDVAEMYPSPQDAATHGRSEEVVGAWLKRKPRDAVLLATKICGGNRAESGDVVPYLRGGFAALDWHHFAAACEASLRRLKTDHIDLYQTHWPDRHVPMEAQLEAFDRLIEAGKVRYAGVSNETPWGLTRLIACSEASGLPRIVSLQNNYSLLWRDYEHGMSEVCVREDVGMMAFSPLGQGALTGKYSGGKFAKGTRFAELEYAVRRFGSPEMLARADRYVEVARRHGLDPAAMAMAWVASRPGVATVLTSCSRPSQLRNLLAHADLTLGAETLADIDAIA